MSRPTGRLTTTGEGNGKPEPSGYRWRSTRADQAEQAQAEADAAWLEDTRRRLRRERDAELAYMHSVPGQVPDPEDLPAGAGLSAAGYNSALPSRLRASTVKGDSRPAGPYPPWDGDFPGNPAGYPADANPYVLPAGAGYDLEPVTTAPCSADRMAPVKGDSPPAGPPVRCGGCGYLTGTRGHQVACGGDT